MPHINLPQYQPHQRVGWQAAYALPLGALGTALLGGFYAQVMGSFKGWFGDLVVATLTLVLVAYFGTRAVLRLAHSRHGEFNSAVAMVLVLVFLWARWQTTMGPHLKQTSFGVLLLTAPTTWVGLWPALAELLGERARLWWWLAEALVGALACWAAALETTAAPYSEISSRWARRQFEAKLVPPPRHTVNQLTLEHWGVGALLQCTHFVSLPTPQPHLVVTVFGTPYDAWVTVRWATPQTDAQGRLSYRNETLVSNWELRQSDFDRLRRLVTRP
jgi:hypothetical protein